MPTLFRLLLGWCRFAKRERVDVMALGAWARERATAAHLSRNQTVHSQFEGKRRLWPWQYVKIGCEHVRGPLQWPHHPELASQTSAT